jgi:hypothetical protein
MVSSDAPDAETPAAGVTPGVSESPQPHGCITVAIE